MLRFFVALLLQQYFTVLLGVATGVLTARGLAVEERGLLALFFLTVQLASRVGSLGVEIEIQRNGVLTSAESKGLVLLALLGAALLSPVVVWLNLPLGLGWALLAAAAVALVSLHRFAVSELIFHREAKAVAVVNIAQALFQLVIFAAAFALKSFSLFLGGWLLSLLLAAALSMNFARRHGKTAKKDASPAPTAARDFATRGLRHASLAIPEIGLGFCMELPLVRAVLGESQTGLYAIANTISNIYTQMFTLFSALVAKTRIGGGRFALYLLSLLPLAAALLWGKDIIVLLYGERYGGAAAFLGVLLPVAWVAGATRVEILNSQKNALGARSLALLGIFAVGFPLAASLGGALFVPTIGLTYVVFCLALLLLSKRGPSFERKIS